MFLWEETTGLGVEYDVDRKRRASAASLELRGLLHFLPAFGTEFGPRCDRFPAIWTRRRSLSGRRHENGGSTMRAESGALLHTGSAIGASTGARLGVY